MSCDDPSSHDFNWVKTRYECTAPQVFPRLRDLAERSVTTRKEQIIRHKIPIPPPRIDERASDVPTFTVYRGGSGPDPAADPRVRFCVVNGATIRVDGDGLSEPFDVTVGMDEEGRCVLRVDGSTLQDWQVLHRALDALLFY